MNVSEIPQTPENIITGLGIVFGIGFPFESAGIICSKYENFRLAGLVHADAHAKNARENRIIKDFVILKYFK